MQHVHNLRELLNEYTQSKYTNRDDTHIR